jgi:ribosomal protein S15P/S13E
MKNVIIPILGAVSIISTGAVAWLLATPASVDPRSVKLESDLQDARKTIAQLRAELAKKPATVVAPSTQVADVPMETAPAVPPGQGNLRDMLTTPQMRAMIDEQQAAQIEVGYARLFEHLQLNPEERENFKNLLTARQKMMTDLSLQLMDPKLTPQKRQELIEETKHQRSVYEASIQKFLNEPADYKTFQHWDGTLPERTQYDTMGRSLFAASQEPLNQAQEQQLIDLIAEVRKSPYSVGGLNDQTGTDPNKLTDEMIRQQELQIDSNNRIVSERAASFLTPGQLQTLTAYLNQTKAVAKSSLGVSKLILQGTK